MDSEFKSCVKCEFLYSSECGATLTSAHANALYHIYSIYLHCPHLLSQTLSPSIYYLNSSVSFIEMDSMRGHENVKIPLHLDIAHKVPSVPPELPRSPPSLFFPHINEMYRMSSILCRCHSRRLGHIFLWKRL